MYLAGSHQFPDRPGNVLNRHLRINAMLVEQINVFNLQAPQRSFDGFANMFRAAVGPGDLAILDTKSKLGSDDGLFPPPFERPPHQLFIDEGAVDLGGVKEIQSQFERAVNGGNWTRSRRLDHRTGSCPCIPVQWQTPPGPGFPIFVSLTYLLGCWHISSWCSLPVYRG